MAISMLSLFMYFRQGIESEAIMNKAKKISNMIAELEQQRDTQIASINAQIATCKEQMQDASAVLEVTDDPDEYEAAKASIAKNKTSIELYNRKIERIRVLDEEHFREIKADAKAEHQRDTDQTAQQINDALIKLIEKLDAYCQRSKELSNALRDAEDLAGISEQASRSISYNAIGNAIDDRYGWYQSFVQYYFDHLAKVAVMKLHNVKI